MRIKILLVSLMAMLFMPALAFAQEVAGVTGEALALAGLVVASLLPFATRYSFEGLQQLLTGLAKLPVMAKVVIGVVIGFSLTHLSAWLGLPLPAGLEGLTETSILGIFEGLASVGMHYLAGKKAKA
jgi:hypothetical protein